jgi:hypothetical protein
MLSGFFVDNKYCERYYKKSFRYIDGDRVKGGLS